MRLARDEVCQGLPPDGRVDGMGLNGRRQMAGPDGRLDGMDRGMDLNMVGKEGARRTSE